MEIFAKNSHQNVSVKNEQVFFIETFNTKQQGNFKFSLLLLCCVFSFSSIYAQVPAFYNTTYTNQSGTGGSASYGPGFPFEPLAFSSYKIVVSNGSTGDQYFRFNSPSSGNQRGPNSNGDYVTTNSATPFTDIINTGGNAYRINIPNTSYRYVFKTDAGVTQIAAFQIQGSTIQSIAGHTAPTGVSVGQNVTISATLSGAFSIGQAAYLRYVSGTNFSSATVVKMTTSGTTVSATIPSATNTSGATISYYMFTSGDFDGSDGSTGTTVMSNANADLYTINALNNGGSNYSYTVIPAGTWIGPAGGGDWNTAVNWSGGVPTTSTDAYIPAGNTVLMINGNAVANSLTIANGAGISFSTSTSYSLSITNGGYLTNNGTFTAGIGTLVFLGSGSVGGSSTTTFNNLTLNGSTAFNTAPTISAGGTLLLNASGATVTGNSPTYSCSSLLEYKTGVSGQTRGAEWTSAASGAGFPGNVWITGNTVMNGNNSGNNNIALCGNLTVDNGSALYMDYSSITSGSTLTVGGNTIINGNLSLGYVSGGDLFMYGNFTVGASAQINYNTASHSFANTGGNGRSINFIGTGTQVITYTPGGTLTIPIINISQSTSGGRVQLATGTNISIPDYGSTLNVIKLIEGDLDLNGQTITVTGGGNAAGYYIGILANGGPRTITGIANSRLAITATSFWAGVSSVSVDTALGGTLIIDTNVVLATNVGFAPSRFTTVNGTLELDQLGTTASSNGFITDRNNFVYDASGNTNSISGHCVFGNKSTLLIKDGGTFSRNIEWDATGIGTIGVTPGFPNNVVIDNNTIYNIGDVYMTSGIADRALNGTLIIEAGSQLLMGTMDNGSHHFYVGGDVSISGTLQLATGTSTDSIAGDIYVGGNWTRNAGGVFDYNAANPRAVTFNNATSGTITAPSSTGETFAYAYLSKTSTSAKITLADSVTITRQLGLNEGVLDLSNSNLTIISNRNNTASIGTIGTPANVSLPYSGTGRFVIQRFFAAHRSWRLVTAPISSSGISQTINQAWQEGVVNTSNALDGSGIVNPSPGYGTLITGAFSGTSGYSYGYDPGTQANPSIYYLNNAGTAWFPPANTNATSVTAYPGYMLFVRGSRNYIIGTQYTPADTATLNPMGKINIGDTTISATAAVAKIIGNPYASGFNFITTAQSGLAGNGGYADLYEWDPLLTGSNSVGAFVTLHWNGSRYTCVPNPISPIDTINLRIESGSAFMVQFTGAGSLTIHETDKTINNALVFRPANVIPEVSLRANLYAYNSDGTVSLNDGVLNLFDQSYDNAVNDADAVKFGNIAENISLSRNGNRLAVESRQPVTSGDSVFYNLTNLGIKKYRLQLIGTNLSRPGLTAYLEDTLLHTHTVIPLNDITNIDFVIPDAATATNSAGRFIVEFRQADAAFSPLPVTFTAIAATQTSDNTVLVKWSVANEINIRQYEIEKSTDGKNFVVAGTMAATGNNSSTENYRWVDANAGAGNNFYRIESIGTTGAIQYSNSVNVNSTTVNAGISVYPNPVVDGNINVWLKNMPKGIYDMHITNADGQLIANNQFEHSGGDMIKLITVKNYIAGGIYNLEIVGPDKTKTVIKIVAEGK